MVKRLEVLREEYAKGQQQLAMLDQKRAEVRDTLLRISGAIQVLEELTAADQPAVREIDRGQDRSVA
jgi:prefoldin subunit 5